jgi:urea transport system permease protein
MGGTFIAVVMFFPNGLAGLIESPWMQARLAVLGRFLPAAWRPGPVPETAAAKGAEDEDVEDAAINLNTTEATK